MTYPPPKIVPSVGDKSQCGPLCETQVRTIVTEMKRQLECLVEKESYRGDPMDLIILTCFSESHRCASIELCILEGMCYN